MIPDKIHLLEYQSNSWKRILYFMTEENIHLKKMVSHLLTNKISKISLEQVEDLYGRFLKNDELIALLRDELTTFDKLIRDTATDHADAWKYTREMCDELTKKFEVVEQQFTSLKYDFGNYLNACLR